ncbi:stalk domain-containing protein [Bacillus sp. 3255]|uniref:stalk domain-containing protein n=1 Tax=Bacillus sp. 3255 TaxID=2817904 RepID=UPI00285AFF1D|nr:stalk domain-containing protein [Bacillus sp. 3255]MDR6879581.1 hypothetical protein [Bacillus sp. 3255]
MFLRKNQNIRNTIIGSVMAGSLLFSGIAFAFGETSPSGVSFKEFSLLDTATDVVGSADFTPEGNKDGHFRLKLSLTEKKTIKSIVLRSTDAYGKDNYQGVWRTNRATTGWLLGIVQDKTVTKSSGTTHESEIINPGFRKNVNEPVGEFNGELTFDLYASNNGTIKETQYYVLEIETPQGTIVSKPIKYMNPMITDGTAAPSTTTVPSPTPVPIPSPMPSPTPTPAPVPASAESSKDIAIQIFFKGTELHFEDAQPIVKEGRTLVPFRKLFETLGFTVQWVENDGDRKAIGTKNGLSIELTIDSKNAIVNDSHIALDVPAQIIDGSTMVPLRFVSENSGYRIDFSSSGNVWKIRIEDAGGTMNPEPSPIPTPDPTPAPTPAPTQGAPEPYVVKGQVHDAKGNPLSGVVVYADNQLLYNSNLAGVTDDNGNYRIELTQIATTWHLTTKVTQEYNDKEFSFDLNADVDKPFAGSTGAIRDFTWKNFDGKIYVYPYFTSPYEESMPEFEMTDVEFTLTPVGPLLNGSAGQTITKRGGPVPGGAGLKDIPIGKYRATARWVPAGHAPMPLQMKWEDHDDAFADSIVFEFEDTDGISSVYRTELEIKLP